ncbi:endonuclease [Flavobacteriaceae bacterium Ap0902]|nr:endonuclease [Flavobacteriaceae bacterium Ap0902]
MAEHNDFGQLAESFIVQKYLKNNYQILERNWRSHPLEIDIIAFRDDVLVIIEVKARSYNDVISPEDAVNQKKKRFLVKAANDYMIQNHMDIECRFDIAVVLKKKDGLAAKIYVDAFQPYEL